MSKEVWYQQTTKNVFSSLHSNPSGLTESEAALRLKKYGVNKLPNKGGHSIWQLLLEQVKSPLVYVLFVAAIISYLIGETVDVIVILIVVVLNTVVGFWQEYKADKSIQQLQSLVKQYATVLRGGETKRILSQELVIGDILLLESGDKIPADARLFEVNNLQINEAALTGESFPVSKQVQQIVQTAGVGDRSNMVFMGTSVSRGRGKAIVVATAEYTQIGEIASLVDETEDEKTPLQKQLDGVSRFLTILVLISTLLLVIIGVIRQFELEELLLTAAALAVSAIPEGLIVSLTLVLAFGMQRILKQKALVRKLVAAETLGSVSIVCSDKTGTITKGEMQVDQLLIGGQSHANHIKKGSTKATDDGVHLFALRLIALCNNAYLSNPEEKLSEWEVKGDSTDSALLKAALQAGFNQDELKEQYLRLDEIPFDERYKFQATLQKTPTGVDTYIKGAPEAVLAMCTKYVDSDQSLLKPAKLSKEAMTKIEEQYQHLTKQGLRVLALAYKQEKKSLLSFDEIINDRDKPEFQDLVFLGWVALKDPVRKEVPKAFATMKKAGIRTVIITGDHKYTVQAIVDELGLRVPEDRIMTGVELDALSDTELERIVASVDIFARVAPRHKLRIINAWKAKGEVVAMLGDGVNDAPALKAADIGVAIGDATDVAKETSDMILLDGNFAVVEAAIREGRIIFDNIRRVFLYLMSDSFTGISLITLALFVGYPVPLLAVHILWINIASDGVLNLALTVEPAERDVMDYPPRKKDERIVSKEVIVLILTFTGVAVMLVFSLYAYFLRLGVSIEYLRTLVFAAFAIDSGIYVFSMKSLRQPIWKINPFSNPWLVLAAIITIGMQIAIIHIPFLQPLLKTMALSLSDWVLVFGIGIIGIIIREIIKWLYWHKRQLQAL